MKNDSDRNQAADAARSGTADGKRRGRDGETCRGKDAEKFADNADDTRRNAEENIRGKETDGKTDGKTDGTSGAEAAGKSGPEKVGEKPDERALLKQCLADALENGRKLAREKERLETELAQQSEKLDGLNKRARQLVDEYDNYRRRTADDKQKAYADAVCKAASALLPALDSLERALPFAESNPESFRQGVEMTLRQLSGGFEKLGVEEIDTKKGAPFDPKLHNAVMHVDDDSLGESVVCEVFQKGYQIDGRVIRHSVVKVAN